MKASRRSILIPLAIIVMIVQSPPAQAAKLTPIIPGSSKDNPGTQFPVKLSCPAENGGVLELILRARIGEQERLRAIYSGQELIKVEVAVSETKHGAFRTIADGAMDSDQLKRKVRLAEFQSNSLASDTCRVPENLRRFENLTERNRKILNGQISED